MSSHDATLEFDYETASRADLVAESVAREIGEIDDERSQTTIDREGTRISIEIDADDIIALRAALNTWFSLIDVAERTADVGAAVLESK
ncbi:KEOPS complex subunit Pcc1 [Natrinema versiforme]|uniref:KEOPS complex Pcc1-like subunit n=1 Tax=Natrinema versiforme JCM 10478 TaxID=1227496 RepID=L9YAG9_9EURY|nr:KEOPS complex subunit Pcc1 [Natrinema versiforme]ELY70631.1 KEOPS complex Pcc1-like subunit [Natrinema versiforme JCM 10478]